jgi:hypothetical protein
MPRSLPLSTHLTLAAMLALSGPAMAQGDCLTTFQWPTGAVTVPTTGAVTNISTCNFLGEHSAITGIVPGGNYQFTVSVPAYITVREGAYNGPVVTQGYAPVQVIGASGANLYPHWTTNENCDESSSGCVTTSVQMLLDCTPPLVNYSFVEDCDAGTFDVVLQINSVGDGGTVDVAVTIGGETTVESGLGVGPLVLGPFPLGSTPAVVVQHATDPLCNVDLGTLQFVTNCPLPVVCGEAALQQSYCYDNNDNSHWAYESIGSGALRITFLAGTIESANWDHLTIYDGPDASGPVLFNHTQTSQFNLAGLQLTSASGFLYMAMSSDGSVSCTSGSQTQWQWEVVCLDCSLPTAQVSVDEDCDAGEFTITVDVTSTGDGSTVDLAYTVNGGTQQVVAGVGTGPHVLGPFLNGSTVNVRVEHESSDACDVDLGSVSDSGNCPAIVVCGAPALQETYCYTNFDNTSWAYLVDGSGSMRLTFLAGTIESASFDHLTIYDGLDASGPVLFNHTQTSQFNLAGLQVYSTTGSLFMVVTSDVSSSCAGGGQSQWQWEVECLDCNVPVATVSLDEDCTTSTYTLTVDVSSTGDASTVDIVYSVNGGPAEVEAGVGTGAIVLGPFPTGSTVQLGLEHASNPICNVDLGSFIDSGECPVIVTCGAAPLQQTYCYTDNDNQSWLYQGSGPGMLMLTFLAGTIESASWDHLTIYDGLDATGPILFNHTQTSQFNLAGLEVTSTTGSIYMVMTSDGSVSCNSGVQTQWQWQVVCLDCTAPTTAFAIVQDCDNYQYFVDVTVSDLGSEAAWQITNTGGAPMVDVTAVGTYQVGPFTSGVPVTITLSYPDVLCVLSSGTLVNPLCPQVVCGATPIEETYCYVASDNHAWSYTLPGGSGTLRLVFQRGTIESSSFDRLHIYDGSDETGAVLFTHTNTVTSNLGPTGSAILSAAGNYYGVDVTSTTGSIYMVLQSDAIIQCATSTNYDPFEWSVFCEGCAPPGLTYTVVDDCPYRSFSVQVDLSAVDPAGVELFNTYTGESMVATSAGEYTFGPYPLNDAAHFEVRPLDQPSCFYVSDTLTYTAEECVILGCGPATYGYCYPNNDDRWYTYRSTTGQPVFISFQGGQMLSGDQVVLYDGADETAPVLYQGNYGGDLSGLMMSSTNPTNTMTMRILTNGTGSCADGGVGLPMTWSVMCGSVGIDELEGRDAVNVYPVPTNGLLQVHISDATWTDVRVRVMDLSGRVVAQPTELLQGGTTTAIDLGSLGSGLYLMRMESNDRTQELRIQVLH